jgi:uncharacterized Zn finger protein
LRTVVVASPEDALAVYRVHVERTIAGKDKRSYAEAIRLMKETIRPLLAECGRAADFDSYLAEVRATHRQKAQPDEADGQA